ncbi:M3 family metallopeptidase [Natronospira bacteriovora]|uniref:oligopeptidase A n=1 Tax=Natronospira bacteriovora TaxID=3069753 RepID=A0ABU0W6S3_9GAMM|nr:M3 family metallopeptidase [Natronospira sp. AB-CW4]MDQ2069709.1 M3 family metallopeptidase [Natronospira sp. AB-CW4]
MNNPLLAEFDLPPFSQLQAEHFLPAVEQVLADNRRGIEALLEKGGPWSWESLAEPLEAFDDRLARVFSPISHLNNVRNEEAVREAFNACLEQITRYEAELGQNRGLYEAWQALKADTVWAGLDQAQRKTVDDTLRDFRLSGVALDEPERSRFREIQESLSRLQSRFEENVLDATQSWTLAVNDPARVAGIPEPDLARAKGRAADQEQDGWLFSLEFPDFLAIMQHADDRELRAQMHQANATRASEIGPQGGQFDNGPVMAEIIALRHEAARLLDFSDFAELSLATKMAESGDAVMGFLEDLLRRCRPAAEQEFAELAAFARESLGIETLQPWDTLYASEKRREALHAISDEQLRPYFPLEKVLSGLFEIAGELYGISVESQSKVDAWHEDVRLYELRDGESGERIGRLYVDLYARPGKRGGAWMDECINRRRTVEGLQTPVAYLTCNFGAPARGEVSLLNHDDVITLFHEFGHCLQHLLTEMNVSDVAGIHGVEWDAVELPSQFQEHFAWPREGIDRLAEHHDTGEPLPESLHQAMLSARNFQAAMKLVRQLEFAIFDMRLHREYRGQTGFDVQGLLDEVRKKVTVVPVADYDRFAHSFAHIFGGGYAAGYYSYLWAEVLSSDAFAAFEEAGLFDRETGQRFRRTVLGLGGSLPAADVFRQFRGRDPELSAFLRHHGIGDAA